MKKYLLLTFVAIFTLTVKATMAQVLKNNALNFSSSGIFIEGGNFSFTIIENGTLKEIKPIGEPSVETIERLTPIGVGKQDIYTWTDYKGYQLKLKATRINSDILSLKLEFVNGTLQPVYLKTFHFLNTPDSCFRVDGKPTDWQLATTDIESRRWGNLDLDIPTEKELKNSGAYSRKYLMNNGDSLKSNDRSWRGYYDDITLYAKNGEGLSIAAVDTISDVYFDVKVNGTKMKLEIWGQMSEVFVESGESRSSDEVLFLFKPWGEAQKIRNKWVAKVTVASVTKKPVYGWASWYRSFLDVTENDILNITKYAKIHKNEMPFEVIQIDDGWQIGKYNWVENDKFKSGLKMLADSIKMIGSVPGIWLSPVLVELITSDVGELRRPLPEEWYINYKTGITDKIKLDPSNPAAADYMKKQLKYSYNKGYRFYKLDFSKLPYDARRFYNPKLTRLQAQRELFRLFREAIGDDSYLLACGISDQRSLVPYIDADRIGTDCTPTEGFARSLAVDNLPANPHGLWFPILSMANKSYENRVLSNGDPDVTYVSQTGKTKPAQLLTFNSYIGTFGGLAYTSDKMYIPEFDQKDNIRIMEVLYPVSKEHGVSFSGGWDLYGKEFGYEVERKYGNSVNVVLWNPEHKGTADLTMKHVPTQNIGNKFHVWSFWEEKYKGVWDSNYIIHDVPKYEHELLKLSALSDKPVIIGSNLHISMGATEILSSVIKENSMIIELDPNAGARNGKLFIYSEKSLSNAQSSNSEAYVVKKDTNLYVVTLLERDRLKKEVVTIKIGTGEASSEANILGNKKMKENYLKASFSKSWLSSW